MKRLLLLILSIIKVFQLFAQTVSSNSIETKSKLIFHNAAPYTGKVVACNIQGQIISKYEVKDGAVSGTYETFYESKEFAKDKYQDTAQISRDTKEIQLKQKELIQLDIDSSQLALKINDFINYNLGGPKKVSKMRAKNEQGKLNKKEKALFDELVSKLLELNEISSTKKSLISDIKRIQDQLTFEFKKKEFIPAKELIYEVNNGLKNGKYTKYSYEGEILEEGIYLNNKQEGEWKYYHTNGNLKASGKFVGGDCGNLSSIGVPLNGREGKWVTYYNSGKINQESNWINGVQNGLQKYYFENGQIEEESNYKNGQLEGSFKNYFENGKLQTESNYKNGKINGQVKNYYSNGNTKSEGTYLNDLAVGSHKFYSENGKLQKESNYKNGQLEGSYKSYYENGTIETKEEYLNGKLIGKILVYFPNGQLKIEGLANEDGLTYKFVKRFNEDGSPYTPEWYTVEDQYTKSKNIFAYTKCDNYTCPRLKIWGKNGIYRWAMCEKNSDYLDISTDPKKYATAVWYIKIDGVNQEFYTEYANVTFLPKNIQDALLKASEVALKIGNNPFYYKVSLNGYSDGINWLNK